MPAVSFNIRLDGKAEGCVEVALKEGQSLKEARGGHYMRLLVKAS